MLDQFSATIDKVYAAAGDRAAWREALSAVEELTGSAGAVIHIVAKTESPSVVSLLGDGGEAHFPASEVAVWARDYAAMCPRLATAEKWPNAPYVCDHMIISEHEIDRDPVYEWYGTHGLRYFIGSPLYQNERVQLVWSLQRTRSQGHVQGADVRMFELLKPHLARAASLADQLGTLRSHQRFSSAVLEALPRGAFVLDADGAVLFGNGRASKILASNDGLATEAGRLRTALAADQARLDALIRDATVPFAARSSAWIRIARPSGRLPYAMFVAPLALADGEIITPEAKVLVLVHDTAENRCADVAMLRSLYGLTETEARLASALSGGHSVQSAAALLTIQTATARSHLKSVFQKLGVNRQQDLVRLLGSLSAFSANGQP